jgi:hypothetical protein
MPIQASVAGLREKEQLMRASLLRPAAAAAVALSLALAIPSFAGVTRESVVTPGAIPVSQSTSLLAQTWSWLRGLWAPDTSGADTSWKAGKTAAIRPDEGCGSDPNGKTTCNTGGSSGSVAVAPH